MHQQPTSGPEPRGHPPDHRRRIWKVFENVQADDRVERPGPNRTRIADDADSSSGSLEQSPGELLRHAGRLEVGHAMPVSCQREGIEPQSVSDDQDIRARWRWRRFAPAATGDEPPRGAAHLPFDSVAVPDGQFEEKGVGLLVEAGQVVRPDMGLQPPGAKILPDGTAESVEFGLELFEHRTGRPAGRLGNQLGHLGWSAQRIERPGPASRPRVVGVHFGQMSVRMERPKFDPERTREFVGRGCLRVPDAQEP